MKRIVILLLLFITVVNAQTDTLTLKKAIKIGLQSSLSIQLANSDTVIADEQVTNAWSNLLPKLSVGANYNHLSEMPIQFNFPFPLPASSGALDALYLNATIEQPLFTGLRLLSIKNAANFNKKAELFESKAARNNKVIEIKQAYWAYYKSLKMIEVLDENLDMIESQKKNIQSFFKIGMATKNDLLKILVAESDLKLKIIDAENQSKIIRANFNRVVGLKINNESPVKIENLEIVVIKNEIIDSLFAEALANRVEIKANDFRIKAADENITAAKSMWFPQISANASYNYLKLDGSSMLKSDASNFWWVGVGMKWNIWDWWKTSSAATIAEEKHFQIDVANKMIKDKIELEVYQNYLDVESQKSKIELNKLQVKSASENFQIVNNKFETQMATPTEVSEASALLAESKIKLINSYVDYNLARIKLDNSVGRKIY